MKRKIFEKRSDYEDRLDSIGFQYHRTVSTDGEFYWTEGVAYEFSLEEIEEIESATGELHDLCLDAVGAMIESGDYPEQFGLGDTAKQLIEQSWRDDEIHVYGRFDLCFIEGEPPKMFEYNADTPTALLESSVAQWKWLEEAEGVPHRDQFNSIHEKLIERWRQIKAQVPQTMLYLLASRDGHYEDWGNVDYLADTAMQAGWEVHLEEIECIGYDPETREFIDPAGDAIDHAFKLYPWEWMMREPFGAEIALANTQWYEPPWKMLLSNKAILPVLWRRFAGHDNLLPSFFEHELPVEKRNGMFVRKPILGREGANVQMAGTFADSLIGGSHFVPDYDGDGYVYQEYAPLPSFDGMHPVIGSWVIGDESAGIGIREDRTLISGNGSHFVPHYFVD